MHRTESGFKRVVVRTYARERIIRAACQVELEHPDLDCIDKITLSSHGFQFVAISGLTNRALAELHNCWPLPIQVGNRWKVSLPIMLPWSGFETVGDLTLQVSLSLPDLEFAVTIAYEHFVIPESHEVAFMCIEESQSGFRDLLNSSHPTTALILIADLEFDTVALVHADLIFHVWTFAETKIKDGIFLLAFGKDWNDLSMANTLNLSRLACRLEFTNPSSKPSLIVANFHLQVMRSINGQSGFAWLN